MSLFEIGPKEIEVLDPGPLVDAVNHLLTAEASRSGIPPNGLHLNLRVSEPDGGVDARVLAPAGSTSQWIPVGESVWQMKAGPLSPKNLRAEFAKPGVQDCIKRGGCYCVANGEDYGEGRRKNCDKALQKCFQVAGLPPNYRFYTAFGLAAWASELPAIAALPQFGHPVGDLMRWERWALDPLHAVSFVTDPTRDGIIQDIRRVVQDRVPEPLHIVGQAGVGKTRLALQAFSGLLAAERLLYAPSQEDLPPGLFSWLEFHPSCELILVVDEYDVPHQDRLRAQAVRCEGRLVLVTIGHSQSDYYTMLPPGFHILNRMGDEQIRAIVEQVSPNLHPQGVDYVVRVSSGFAKLATALARAVAQNPETLSAAHLVRGLDVDSVLRTLIPDDSHREVMKSVAVLTRVGWEGEVAVEGQAIAEFIGIPWKHAQDTVALMVRHGYITRQGRYRYVTPHLLAVWLTLEVWDARRDSMLGFIAGLPTPGSRRAALERLADLGDNDAARNLVEGLLGAAGLFPDLEALDDYGASEILAMLATASPKAGLQALERILLYLPRDRLREFSAGRRQVVWTLGKLAWHRDTFRGAAGLLLTLALAENEPYANNATAIWSGLFQTSLGGTEVPALERHELLREALENDVLDVRILALAGISSALQITEMRDSDAEHQRGRLVPPEWHPANRTEDQDVRRSALALLDSAMTDPYPEVAAKARDILLHTAPGLIRLGLADDVVSRLLALPYENEDQRQELWRALQWILSEEPLPDGMHERVAARASELVGDTLHDRIRRWVGEADTLDYRDLQKQGLTPEDMAARMADEAYEEPEALLDELDWLASDAAKQSYAFGARLGELDENRTWLPELVARASEGKGIALLATYLRGRATSGDTEWVGHLLDDWTRTRPDLAPVTFEATWVNEPGEAGAQRMIQLVEQGWLDPRTLGRLAYGKWMPDLSAPTVQKLLHLILSAPSPQSTESGLFILRRWLDNHGDDRLAVASEAWELLRAPSQLANTGMGTFLWRHVAAAYVGDAPAEMASLILSDFEGAGSLAVRGDHRLEVLGDALRANAQEVWPPIAAVLLRKDMVAFRLRHSLREWGVEAAGSDVLLGWAQDHKPDGPRILADLAVPLSWLARALLSRYEDDEVVGEVIEARYMSGMFRGNESDWLRSKLAMATEWMTDENPAVSRWARRVADHLQQRIRQAIQEEEEEGL